MIQFILNQKEISTALPSGTTLLDFIRYHQHLTGTKIGCREGDCGACTVLTGEIKDGELIYSSATSCLMPLGNAAGRHIVTIEGVNLKGLNAMQEAFAKEGATQCGFCTPGFIVSLAGFCMSSKAPDYKAAIDSVNGNICRCTGYKSIERAAAALNDVMQSREGKDPLQFAVDNKMIPEYFLSIKSRLQKISMPALSHSENGRQLKYLGGGTDLYVQQHDTIMHEEMDFLFDKTTLNGITLQGNTCIIGAAATVSDMAESAVFREHFPAMDQFVKLISSTQIRNMATVGGNFINASPIGDLTVFFLALNTTVQLGSPNGQRVLLLENLFKGYKSLNRQPEEILEKIKFELPRKSDYFNFEKVCKRTHLDIATVNTAIWLKMEEDEIVEARLSAGGVSPIPLFLKNCSSFLTGKKVSAAMISELTALAQTEISPISDVRGTEAYKRLLLSQLIKAHFIKLFPALPLEQVLYA